MYKIQIGEHTVTIDSPPEEGRAQGLIVRLAEAVTGSRNAYHDVALTMSFNKTLLLAEQGRAAREQQAGRAANHEKLQADYAALRESIRGLPGASSYANSHEGALDALNWANSLGRKYEQLRAAFTRIPGCSKMTYEQMMTLLLHELPDAVRRDARDKKNKAKKNKAKKSKRKR